MKAFLSHSSHDKVYVEMVAQQLGPDKCVYDNWTFEEGMKTLDEIQRGLQATDLFVVFLSEASLISNWVKTEIINASNLHKNGQIKRIFPVLINNSISHQDLRIPIWMREEYNLRYISKPTVAARRIQRRLREIAWNDHPRLKEREEIFVGRNNLIQLFEERIATIDKKHPVCVIAGGMKSVGRRSLLLRCLVKANIINKADRPSVISLNSFEGLEDFILKVYDLNFSTGVVVTNLMTKTIKDKVSIAIGLLKDLQASNDILLIVDNGCLVTHESILNKWFVELLDGIKDSQKITITVASSQRPFRHYLLKMEHIFALEVPVLDKIERTGLFKRYAEFEELFLPNDDLRFFENLFQGFPEQIFYTVNLIKSFGLEKAKNDSYLIVEFNADKVMQLLASHTSNQKVLDFIYLLARFDYISYKLIAELIEPQEKDFFRNLIDKLLSSAICECLGANREYIRLNDAVRDYIGRNKIQLPEKYKKKLEEHVQKFLDNYNFEDTDVSEFFFMVKESLLRKNAVDEKYLIPSHFLMTMKELYDYHKNYADVIRLAEKVIQNQEYIDENLMREIRHYLCLSLARLRDSRFLQEVHKIEGPQHDFLFGFWYRLNGNYAKALEKLNACIVKRETFPGARRELVQVYLLIEDYETATGIAKRNFELDKSNPYHIQAYFNCLIKGQHGSKEKDDMNDLLRRLRLIKSEKAGEMFYTATAQFAAFCDNDQDLALQYINEAIKSFQEKTYPLLTKFDICEKFGRINDMKETLEMIEKLTDANSYYYNIYIRIKAIYLAATGQSAQAEYHVNYKLKNYPDKARLKLLEYLKKYL